MTPEALAAALHIKTARAAMWAPHLTRTMDEYDISTPERQTMFLAQIGHESGGLAFVVELWGPTPAQVRYEGRADLGNTEPGDGYKFRGRGLIQTTGRFNYRKTGLALDLPLEDEPDLLAELPHAARSAGWYWSSRGLNILADAGDFDGTTRLINGGQNGRPDRLARWGWAKEVLA